MASNAALREMQSAFKAERERLDALSKEESDKAWDALGDRMDALAKYLDLRAYLNGFDAWDFEASFLNAEEFRGLFESDREWLMRDWLLDDLEAMLEAVGAAQADEHTYSRTELRNLADVLKHIRDSRAEAGLATLERLLASAS